MHAPSGYVCPFCKLIAGDESNPLNRLADIVYQDEYSTAMVAPKQWQSNPGHVLVVPNHHYENLYDIPDKALARVYLSVKKVALAIKRAYDPDGVSTRQHNEPGGGQDVWHFHVHIFPRYHGDRLYQNHENTRIVDAPERAGYAKKLRAAIR